MNASRPYQTVDKAMDNRSVSRPVGPAMNAGSPTVPANELSPPAKAAVIFYLGIGSWTLLALGAAVLAYIVRPLMAVQ